WYIFYFFFSSRRRHTRSKRDWSSDVCSSDLVTIMPVLRGDMKLREIMPMWVVCYIGNMIGISLICFLFIKSGAQEAIMQLYLKRSEESRVGKECRKQSGTDA